MSIEFNRMPIDASETFFSIALEKLQSIEGVKVIIPFDKELEVCLLRLQESLRDYVK